MTAPRWRVETRLRYPARGRVPGADPHPRPDGVPRSRNPGARPSRPGRDWVANPLTNGWAQEALGQARSWLPARPVLANDDGHHASTPRPRGPARAPGREGGPAPGASPTPPPGSPRRDPGEGGAPEAGRPEPHTDDARRKRCNDQGGSPSPTPPRTRARARREPNDRGRRGRPLPGPLPVFACLKVSAQMRKA